MKIVFFGTANVALPILEALQKNHEIAGVVTTPDVPVGRKQLLQESPVSALATDLKLLTFKPKSIKNNSEFVAQLQELNADLYLAVAYGKIIPMEIISIPKHKTLNVHFSLLPKYRGPSPIQTALLNGDEQTGISIFVLDEKVDTGPIIYQEPVDVEPDDNYFTLSDKMAHKSAKVINSVVADYVSGKVIPLPQDDSAATNTKIITKDDGRIDWNKTAMEIYNQFRAFYIWPGLWTTFKGENLKIMSCFPIQQGANIEELSEPGTVLEGGLVACGRGSVLKISTLQLAGKNEVSVTEFLNGYRDFVGSKLE